MMKAFSLLPLVAAYQVMDTQNHVDVQLQQQHHADTFDGMKSMLKGISAKQKKGEKIDDTTRKSVRDAIESINRELMQALGDDVTRTQKMLDDERDAVIFCDTQRSNWVTNTENGHAFYKTEQSAKQTTHENCRTAEAGLCAEAGSKCDILSGQVCGWEHCKKPSAASWSNGDTDAVNQYMLCLENWFQAENATYYTNKQNCLEAVNEWHQKTAGKDGCDRAQEDFEAAFCDTESNVEMKCKEYRECRNQAHASYNTVRDRVQDLELVYQTQRVALHSLECYGNKILNNDTDISDCETPAECCTLDGCPFLEYKELPACTACTEPDPTNPSLCTGAAPRNAFATTYYGQYDETCTPVIQCVPCWAVDEDFSQDEGSAQCADWNAEWATASQGCPA